MSPISGFDPIDPVMRVIQGIAPKRILDVGMGCGQWGFLARQFHDMRYGRFARDNWQTTIYGIEAFAPYRNPSWDLYSKVFVGDAYDVIHRDLSPKDMFDVVVMIEVLEHFEKARGIEVLKRLAHLSKNLIFSYANMEQGEFAGNSFEVHRSTWTDGEILEIFPNAIEIYRTGVGTFFHVHCPN